MKFVDMINSSALVLGYIALAMIVIFMMSWIKQGLPKFLDSLVEFIRKGWRSKA